MEKMDVEKDMARLQKENRRKKELMKCTKILDEQIQKSLPEIAKNVLELIKEELKKNKSKDQVKDNENKVQKNALVEQEKRKPKEVKLTVHKEYACNGCGASPIIGILYKCSVCPDFDYCETCEDTIEHPHPFLKVLYPEQDPKIVVPIVESSERKKSNKGIKEKLCNIFKKMSGSEVDK